MQLEASLHLDVVQHGILLLALIDGKLSMAIPSCATVMNAASIMEMMLLDKLFPVAILQASKYLSTCNHTLPIPPCTQPARTTATRAASSAANPPTPSILGWSKKSQLLDLHKNVHQAGL